MKINIFLAVVIIILTFLLFWWVIARGLGGNEALFAILGYISAWAEMVVIFFFRKKPSEGKKP